MHVLCISKKNNGIEQSHNNMQIQLKNDEYHKKDEKDYHYINMKRELICLLLFTCNYVVSVWRGFLFLWVLGMGYLILLWRFLSLPYNYMTEIRWATPIATAKAIAESEWKRHLEEARAIFKTWKFFYPRGTELDWTLCSARQGIRSVPAKHVWKNRQHHHRMVLISNDQYLRVSTIKMKDREPVIKFNGHTRRSSDGNGHG